MYHANICIFIIMKYEYKCYTPDFLVTGTGEPRRAPLLGDLMRF